MDKWNATWSNSLFQELLLPDYDYRNISSISITGCLKVNFIYASLWRANKIEEIIVQNIRDYLNFDIFIESDQVKLLRLSNIGRIPLIATHTFTNLKAIDTFAIDNVLIENFEEDFTNISVSHFILTNVTIKRINKLSFSEKGTTLRIVNSQFHNITSSPNFVNFQNVEIINSKIVLYTPGVMSIQGENTIMKNNFFSNVSMSLVATNTITISGICADGKSTLRVLSKVIHSTDNRMPNEITYPNDNQPKYLVQRNNTVCKAGNCDCPKNNSQSRMVVPTLIVGLMVSLSGSLLCLFYNYNMS